MEVPRNVPECSMSDLYLKFHENPFTRFSAIWLTVKLTNKPTEIKNKKHHLCNSAEETKFDGPSHKFNFLSNSFCFLSDEVVAVSLQDRIIYSAQISEYQRNVTGSSAGIDGNLTTCAATSGGVNAPWWAIVLGARYNILSVELSPRALTEGAYDINTFGTGGKIKYNETSKLSWCRLFH